MLPFFVTPESSRPSGGRGSAEDLQLLERTSVMNDSSIEDRLNQLTGTVDATPISEDLEFSVMADPAVSQHIIRSHDGAQDLFAGEFRISIPPQQTIHVLHVPLHPPMNSKPSVEAFAENEGLRVRVTDVQRFGVRLEIKADPSNKEIIEVIQVQIAAE